MQAMIDINSRIDWKAGMEISAQTFKELNENINFRQQLATRIANNNQMGLLPDAEFCNTGGFVKSTFEMERFLCMALLPSGKIINADERVEVKIPILYGEEYYLGVCWGKEHVSFEKEEVPFVRPKYTYGIYSLDELESNDAFPIIRFKAHEGTFSIDTDYIPPCLFLSSDKRFASFIQQFSEELEALVKHANMEDGDGKRCLLRYIFQLKKYDLKGSTRSFIQFTQEMAQAVDYYVVSPHANAPIEIPNYSAYDSERWMRWLNEYLTSAKTILDTVVLDKQTIDFDLLKEQIKEELYARIYSELHDRLTAEIKGQLQTELSQSLKETLSHYIDETLRPELRNALHTDLSDSLFEKLYHLLYESLYNALFVPVEEEKDDIFTPQI